jgi:Mitochondrial ribosomal protein L27
MNALVSWTSRLACTAASVSSRCQTFPWLQGSISLRASASGWWGQQQIRGSKYLSKSAKKRLVLTTKRARKGFYKGKGSTKEGSLTSKGRFVLDPLRRLQLVVPDLTGFKVRHISVRSPAIRLEMFLSLVVALVNPLRVEYLVR